MVRVLNKIDALTDMKVLKTRYWFMNCATVGSSYLEHLKLLQITGVNKQETTKGIEF